MRTFNNDIMDFTKSSTNRMGISFAKEKEAKFLNRFFSECPLRVKDICEVSKGTAITEKETENGVVPVVAGGKEAAYFHSISNRAGNIITISASGANSGYVNYWNVPIWASDCTTVKSKDENKYLTKFVYYLFKLIQEDIYLLQKGPDQPHVYPEDIAHLLLPDIDIDEQKDFIRKAHVIEKKIDRLEHDKNSDVQHIIDDVFTEKFHFDISKFEELKSKKCYKCTQSVFSKNPDLRFSAKFHRPAGEYVQKELFKITDKRIKDFLSEPIILGASISPQDYDDNGDKRYVSMATIRSWKYVRENASRVSNMYYRSKMDKRVQKDDIIMARSGEGTIGKVAIITDNIDDVFADFTMRIRLVNYNGTFAYYYFRTSYFQYLIGINKKGLGNNTNIFPINIQEFPLPDIDLVEQKNVVDEIKAKIAKMEGKRKKIRGLQESIIQLLISDVTHIN